MLPNLNSTNLTVVFWRSRLPMILWRILAARSFSGQSFPLAWRSNRSIITPRNALCIKRQGLDQSDILIKWRLKLPLNFRLNPYFNAQALGHFSIIPLLVADQARGLFTHPVLPLFMKLVSSPFSLLILPTQA